MRIDSTAERVHRELLLRTRLTHLAEPGLAPLAAGFADEVTFAPGRVIYRAGDPARHFYAFVEGEVELAADGIQPWIVQSQSGIGLLDVLADRPRTFTATAVTGVRAMRVASEDYLDFLEEHFELVAAAVLGIAKDVHDISLSLAPDGGFAEVADAPSTAGLLPPPAMNLVQKIEAMRESPLFRRANVQAVVRLATLGREIRAGEGGTVFQRGEAAGNFFLVAQGVVEATREAPRIVGRFGRGDVVCGHGALGDADNQYVAVARSPSVVLALSEEDCFDVMEEHFRLTRSVLGGMASEYERLLIEHARRTGSNGAAGIRAAPNT